MTNILWYGHTKWYSEVCVILKCDNYLIVILHNKPKTYSTTYYPLHRMSHANRMTNPFGTRWYQSVKNGIISIPITYERLIGRFLCDGFINCTLDNIKYNRPGIAIKLEQELMLAILSYEPV